MEQTQRLANLSCIYSCIKKFCFYTRKQWVKRQCILHSYGEEELTDTAELCTELQQRLSEGTIPHHMPATTLPAPDNMHVVLSERKCKCGSTTHQRTSHRECPLKKIT